MFKSWNFLRKQCTGKYVLNSFNSSLNNKATLLYCKALFHLFVDDYCYWGSGKSYRGIVKTSISGRPCMQWSHGEFNLQISDYPELAGKHSYCRNPGDKELQPWCYVYVDSKPQKEFCNIPKCGKL